MKNTIQQTNETRERKCKLSKIMQNVALYSLAFEGATRIAEANLPQEYSEAIRTIRYGGEIGACGLGACIGFGLALFAPLYKGRGN